MYRTNKTLEAQIFEDVFEESFTGHSFVMKKVFTKKSIVKNILTRAKKTTLKEFSRSIKRATKNSFPNDLSVKQYVNTYEETVDSTSLTKLPNEQMSRSFGKDSCLLQDVVMFLIPFKSISQSSINRVRIMDYTFWHVTDLQQNFGVLVTSDKQITDACVGELWAILNPTFFPPQCDATESIKKQMPTTSRLVLFTNQILRIGLLSGFELCLHICENGNVCGTPFYQRQSKEDGCLAAVQGKCPRHRSPKNVSLISVKSSLCKKRCFYTSDNSPKHVCTKKHCNKQENLVINKLALEKQMESTSTPMENHNTDKETHSLSDITLVSLTSFLQDFLQSVTINKNDKTDTQAEKQKKFIKSPKNLDLRIRHVIKRLNQFIALRKQYSSTNYQNMLRLLLKLVKQLAVQINQYHVSNTIKAKLESVIFFTKRYIAAHLQPSQALSLEEPIL